MVCLHHHPIAMGSRWLDTVGLAEPEGLWRIVDSHAHVRAVVWGHVHQAYDGQRGDVRLLATPSTGAQFLPKSDRYAVDSRRPPTGLSTCTPMDASIPRSAGSSRCRCSRRRRAEHPLLPSGPGTVRLLLCVTVRADGALHSLWELHGKHNTVYLLGSIHVLRLSDYRCRP